MARIDSYLRSVERFGAKGIILKSGQHVTLRFDTGDRHATQTTSHEQLVELVLEILPTDARESVEAGIPASFPYRGGSESYKVAVTPQGSSWLVVIDVAVAAAPEPAVSPRTASPPSSPTSSSSSSMSSPLESPAASSFGDMPADIESLIQYTSYAGSYDEDAQGTSRVIDNMLKTMKQAGASDLHLCSGSPAIIRLHGSMVPLKGAPTLSPERLMDELMAIAPGDNRDQFEADNDTDFAYAIPDVSRFRVNLFMDRKGPGAVFRAIPFEIPDAAQLGIPPGVLELCNLTKGLVLVTGPTGSGKSTTLAAMIDHINQTRSDHIITIEDPIEFTHPNKKCLVNQREVHTHTKSFKAALRAALREDPDIVLVGEMRDLETIAIAIETAETGHLVFGTLHTTTAPSTIDRLIDQFPPDQQEQVRTMLASSLQGVCAQVLCRKKGGGRVAAHEVLLGSSAVSNLIREGKTFQLFSIMQTSRNVGMKTMNDSLMELVNGGQIDAREAYLKSVNKAEIKTLLARAGHEI